MLRCGKLAGMVGMSRMQIFRLARDGKIPGARKTKGGHCYFRECKALGDWIASTRAKTFSVKAKRELAAMRDPNRNARLSDGPRITFASRLVDKLFYFLRKHPPE